MDDWSRLDLGPHVVWGMLRCMKGGGGVWLWYLVNWPSSRLADIHSPIIMYLPMRLQSMIVFGIPGTLYTVLDNHACQSVLACL